MGLVLGLAACQDSITTPFPPGLEPFDDDAEVDAIDAPVAEELRTASKDTDMIRAYGRGYVLAPPAEVYAVAHEPQVMIALCKTDTQTVTVGNEPQYDLSYLVAYFVDDIVNVEWDDQWRGDIVSGGADDPELAMIKHQKVLGSDFIAVSEGTIQLRATDDPGITELRFVEHLDAIGGSEADVIAGMQHNYDRIVAAVHGAAPPGCP